MSEAGTTPETTTVPPQETLPDDVPANPGEFWVNTIVDWIVNNAGVRKEWIDPKRKFTQEPYNLSVVKVLNLTDYLVDVYRKTYKANIVLSQNWRLAHRGDTVGDFILAFIEVATSEEVGRPKRTGIN